MPVFTLEQCKTIKETIQKLNLWAAKEALTAIAVNLKTAPTLNPSLFDEIIASAFRLTINKEGE